MIAAKTRCKQGVNTNKNATETPCNHCSEIQSKSRNFDNNFLDASKNLMKEE